MGLESTYKELKQPCSQRKRMIGSCLESTYKELKLGPMAFLPGCLLCLESTNKELKHEVQTAVDPVQNQGLESTYKELKRHFSASFATVLRFRVYL